MNARKVAILLALVALSVLTLFVITLIDGSVFGAEIPIVEWAQSGRTGKSLLEFNCFGIEVVQATSCRLLPTGTPTISRLCPAPVLSWM